MENDMKTFSFILSYLLPVLYLAMVYLYYTIFSGKKKSLVKKTTPFLFTLAAIHLLELITRHIALNTMPFSNIHDAFSFLAFSILLVYTIIELSVNNRASGLFILLFAFFLEIISTVNIPWTPETNPLLRDPFFVIHASMSIVGYTALSLSAIYAFMYVIQNRNLKKHKLGVLYNQLPALSYLEKMSIRSVAIGIIMLGLGILHGHIQANNVFGSYWLIDVKVIITDIIWLLYLIGYILARFKRWRGKWMAYLSLAGFIILIIGGVSVVLVFESFHQFY